MTLIGVGFSLIASMYAGAMTLWGKLGSVATKENLIDHNLDERAHPRARELQESCFEQSKLSFKRIEELRNDQIMMMGRIARIIAADAEKDARKKAKRAEIAETSLKRRVRQGETLEDAFIMALEDASSKALHLP